ncbi:MAG: nuclear transport factor 2 family protein [Geminicoccaceae bacterium]
MPLEPTDISGDETALLAKLDRFVAMVAGRDFGLVDELWSDGFVMVGSERGEICRTRAELEAKLRAVFAAPRTLIFDWPRRDVRLSGSVGWIIAEGDLVSRTPDGVETRQPYLASCIFEQVQGTWRWRQFFGSEPA